MHFKCEDDRYGRLWDPFSGLLGWLLKFRVGPVVPSKSGWKCEPKYWKCWWWKRKWRKACTVGEGVFKELECYWSVLWPGFTQLATCGLIGSPDLREQDSLEVSVNEEMIYFQENWGPQVLESSWFLTMLPQQGLRSLKVSFLESIVMGCPEGRDNVSTLSWRGLNVHWKLAMLY